MKPWVDDDALTSALSSSEMSESMAMPSPPLPFVGLSSHRFVKFVARCSAGTRGSAPEPTSACAARTARHAWQLAGSTLSSLRLGT